MVRNRSQKIKSFFQKGKKVHLVGIGGVSMRPLALVLRDRGLEISGSDMNASVSTTIPRSPPPAQRASPSLSGPRPGA